MNSNNSLTNSEPSHVTGPVQAAAYSATRSVGRGTLLELAKGSGKFQRNLDFNGCFSFVDWMEGVRLNLDLR